MRSYISYKINTKTTLSQYQWKEFSVIHRYKDFEWLWGQLKSKYEHIIIPPLPEKVSLAVIGFHFQHVQWLNDANMSSIGDCSSPWHNCRFIGCDWELRAHVHSAASWSTGEVSAACRCTPSTSEQRGPSNIPRGVIRSKRGTLECRFTSPDLIGCRPMMKRCKQPRRLCPRR